ncbi:hypothetical protein IAT40_000882 [Kwoniella sp. CBS 6097]
MASAASLIAPSALSISSAGTETGPPTRPSLHQIKSDPLPSTPTGQPVQTPAIQSHGNTIPFLGKKPSRFIPSPSALAATSCSRLIARPTSPDAPIGNSLEPQGPMARVADAESQGSVPLPRQAEAIFNTISGEDSPAPEADSGNIRKPVSAPLPITITAFHPILLADRFNKGPSLSSYTPASSAENSYALSQDSALFDFFRGDAELTPFAEYGGGTDAHGEGRRRGEENNDDDDGDDQDGYFGNWALSESLLVEQGYSIPSHGHGLWRSEIVGGDLTRSEGWDGLINEKDDNWGYMTV